MPANTIPDQPARTPPVPPPNTPPASPTPISLPRDALTLRALPLPTDLHSIQQRQAVVDEIYDLLIASDTSAVVLTGIGGIGKSTLASLVFNLAERERRAGRGPFRDEAVMLRINDNTTFLELATNLFAAVNRPMPDLASIPPQNLAFAVFNALNSTGMPRLIVLDQFESMLDQQSGRALTVHSGVGEFLDALNSQSCACRLLLTSRPRPRGTRDDAPASLHIYPVGKLDPQEGAALLVSQGVTGSEPELYEAVRRCDGHALSLRLLSTLLDRYGIGLTTLLADLEYAQLWRDHIAQNLLDRIFNGLPELSRQLLCAYSVYREAVPIEAVLAVVANTTKAQALTILGSLLNQHLVESRSRSGHYRLHPIVSDYAQNHFVESDEAANKQARQAAHEKAAHYYLQVATAHCPEPDNRRKVSDVEPLIEAVWQFCQAGQFQEAYNLIRREGLFADLKRWGGNSILLEMYQLLLPLDKWQPERSQAAEIYSDLGFIYGDLGKRSRKEY